MKRFPTDEEADPPCIKCCFVGDVGVGKTSLIMNYTKRYLMMNYESTIFDSYAVDVTLDEEPYTLGMFDTAGQPFYESLRAFAYAQSHVYVVCFSVVDPLSLENVEKVWLPEIQRYNRKRRPVILAGMQTDKRYDESVPTTDVISRIEGQMLAEAFGAAVYIECSVHTEDNIQQIFDEVLISAVPQMKKKKSGKLRVIIRRLSDRIKSRKG